MVRVKICGITRLQDARDAAAAGVDALGFNFWKKSPRYIEPAKAAAIIRRLPPFVSTVAVMVEPTVQQVREILGRCRINFLQFHGEEDPDLVASFPADMVIKAVGLSDRKSLAALKKYPGAGSFLLDSYDAKAKGGTGKTFRWDLALAAKKHKRPIILAGGLTPDNVAEAVASVKPWAVDTASGVEGKQKGIKDRGLMRKFILAAKHART